MHARLQLRAAFALPLAVSFFAIAPSLAQDDVGLPKNSSQGDNLQGVINPLENLQFILTLAAFAFGLLIISAQLISLRAVKNLNADDVARNCAITVVVTAALVLIIAGYNSNQIAPAFGLFGTIVGYLLGRTNRRPDDAPNEKPKEATSESAPAPPARERPA